MDEAKKKPGTGRALLVMWLEDNGHAMRLREKAARERLAAMGVTTTPYAITIATIADLHAKAAAVYEDALAVLEEEARQAHGQSMQDGGAP
jgi:hypothetical protein